ncbi:MAG TPA: DNA repair protein RecN [Vicinamibacterales bacterium]|jgi:DNA repair protein RecN (Recombination protein N)
MLRVLRIRNLAVIESVEVEFGSGFNVLTGETGAGKSIVVEAVGLLLGARASADLVRTGEPQATIEAVFEDDGHTLRVRREVTSQGRSRSFIDGTPASAGALRELSGRLVELHGQHEHQTLLDPLSHLPLIDSHARLESLVERVASTWRDVRLLREQLDRARMDGREKAARLDLIAFQLGEIEKAAPRAGEDDELTTEKAVLANAERVQRLCEESYSTLYDSDQAVLAGLGQVWKRLSELAILDAQFAEYLAARDTIKSQLEDLSAFLRRYADGIDASPERLQQVEDRLALVERLKRKYGPSLDDVIVRGNALKAERDSLTGATETAGELEQALATASREYLEAARALSSKRRAAARAFVEPLEAVLADLAMERTQFEVRFNDGEAPPESWTERGIDEAEFYLSPNPGEDLRPLSRIVSGGELSRVMLALKTMSMDGQQGKTLIFDEVDAGIGGRVADVVGLRLGRLGERFQVLCITHLPQIASRAATHFHIDKAVRGTRTVTAVRRLDDEGRVEEIARMMGGAVVSDQVRASARELLAGGAPPNPGREAKGKQKTKGESESLGGRRRV